MSWLGLSLLRKEDDLTPKLYREPVLRVLAIAAVLGLAQSFIVPVVVAGLITLALSPVVDFLRRWKLKRWLANAAAVLLCLALVLTTGWLVADQLSAVAKTLPAHRDRILERTHSLGPVGSLLRGAYARFQKSVEAGTAQVTEVKTKLEAESPEPEVPADGLFRTLRSIFLAVAGTIGNSIIILVLVAFFVAAREDLSRRALLFFQEHEVVVDGAVLSEMSDRVSRYLLAELTVNALYGGCVAIITALEGIPHPLFWGVLAFLFRFIPYVGVWIVALV